MQFYIAVAGLPSNAPGRVVEELDALAESFRLDIAKNGLRNPISVSVNRVFGCTSFVLRDGFRRVRAYQELGIEYIPCLIEF